MHTSIKKIVIVILVVIMSAAVAIFPVGILIPILIAGYLLVAHIPIHQLTHYLFYGIIVSAFLGPYLSIPGMDSIFLFRILIVIHFAFFLFEKIEWSRIKLIKVPILSLSVWVLYSLITVLWSNDISLSLRAVYFQLESLYLIFLIVYYVQTETDLKHLFSWIIPIFLLSIGVGIYETVTGNHLRHSAGTFINREDFRATGFLRNTNDYCSYLSIYFPIVIHLIVRKKTIVRTCLSLSFFAVLIMIIISTESRTGLLAFLIVSMLTMMKLYDKWITRLILFAGVTGLGFYVMVMQVVNSQQFSYVTGKQGSNEERLLMYETLIKITKESYFLGVGIGVVPKYIFKVTQGMVNVPIGAQKTLGAHNFWLANLADIGIIGVSFFLLFFMWTSYQSSLLIIRESDSIMTLPASILISFMAISIGSSSIFEMRVTWIGIGIALAIIQLNLKKRMKKHLENF